VALSWQRGYHGAPEASTALASGEMCIPARPHASGTTVESIATPDGTRTYRLHVPPSYTGSSPVPVVINMHGLGSSAFEQEIYSAFSTKSDAQGFIVVYPDGTTTGTGTPHFNAWQLPSPQPDEVAFITALLDTVQTTLCVDQSRVYSTGMSNGAMMSVRLACSLSARIAAIAPVAGSYFPAMANNLNPAETCPDTTAVPVIAFHGTADSTVPFNGGPGSGSFPISYRLPQDDDTPADDILSSWATRDGCTGSRTQTQIDTEIQLIEYGACTNGAQVQLYRVDPGGHTWPGAFDVPSLGYTTHQINATDLIWSFLASFTLPDADSDLMPDGADNCPAVANFDQINTDGLALNNGPIVAGNDVSIVNGGDTEGDACDADDDNDGLPDAVELGLPGPACPPATAPTDPLDLDTDEGRRHDGWECANGTDPTNPSSEFVGVALPDSDGDNIPGNWEARGYNASDALLDSDGDGCWDMVELASVDGNRVVADADRLAVARRALGIYVAEPNQDYVLDIDKNGGVGDSDRLFVARAALLPAPWVPKSC
jgi:polyhydroxybutyrate depolymerase